MVSQVMLGGGSPATGQSRRPPVLLENVKEAGGGISNEGP